jgi:hypothetical protein
MLFTLPFEINARVQATPMASMLINGKRIDAFAVCDPVHAEVPVVVAHCSRCKVAGDRAVASCIATDCPSRDRRAA